jgi:hypothetical protein
MVWFQEPWLRSGESTAAPVGPTASGPSLLTLWEAAFSAAAFSRVESPLYWMERRVSEDTEGEGR